MDIASTEKGRAVADKIRQQRIEIAKQARELLARRYRGEPFTYHEAFAYVQSQGVRIASGSFQALWTDFKTLRVLVCRDCRPGQWRFDPGMYSTRYRESLDCPAVPEAVSETAVDPPPRRPETLYELRQHLPALLGTMPASLVVKVLRQDRGENDEEAGQINRLRLVLEARMAGLSAREKNKLNTELLARVAEHIPPHSAD